MENWKSDRVSSVCPFYWKVVQKYLFSILTFAMTIPITDYRYCNDENKWEFHSCISTTMVDTILPVFRQSFPNEMKLPNRLWKKCIFRAQIFFSIWIGIFLEIDFRIEWTGSAINNVSFIAFSVPTKKKTYLVCTNVWTVHESKLLTSFISNKLWNKCLWPRRIHSFVIIPQMELTLSSNIYVMSIFLFCHLNHPNLVILDEHEPKLVFYKPIKIVFQLTFIATHICYI